MSMTIDHIGAAMANHSTYIYLPALVVSARSRVGTAWQRRFICCLAMASAFAVAPASHAEVINWPTYLRAAAGRQAVVIGELPRDKLVVVRGCARGWCRIEVDGAAGYVERDRVGSLGPPMASEPAPVTSACFDSRRAGYKNGQPLQVCSLRAPPAQAVVASAPAGR